MFGTGPLLYEHLERLTAPASWRLKAQSLRKSQDQNTKSRKSFPLFAIFETTSENPQTEITLLNSKTSPKHCLDLQTKKNKKMKFLMCSEIFGWLNGRCDG